MSGLVMDETAITEAVDEWHVNQRLTNERFVELVHSAEYVIPMLLNRLSRQELAIGALQLNRDAARNLAETYKELAEEAVRDKANLVAVVARANALQEELDALIEPIRQLAAHSHHCVTSDLCDGHQHLEALARALDQRLTNAK